MRVLCDVDAEGGRFLVELAPLNETITELIMDARPLGAVVDIAVEMAEAIREQLPTMMQQTAELGISGEND